MNSDNKNLVLAIALSILVIVGWNYFYGWPQMQRARQAQTQAQTTDGTPPVAGVTGAASPTVTNGQLPATPNPAGPEVLRSREQALAETPRVALDTRSLSGSIALKGARIDDVSLKNYRVTTDPGSANIELLSPSGSPHPYYAEVGFVGQPGSTMPLPGPDTVWTADGDRLTTDKPLTLTWNNGQGLTFRRVIGVDDQYMFTVKDSVANAGAAPVTLFPLFAGLPARQARDVQLRRAP